MAGVSHFQRYSQRENHVTNNVMLVLRQQNAPTAARVGRALIDAGAVKAHPSLRRPAIGSPPPGYDGLDMECSPKQARLMALRNHHLYVGKSNAELVALFWEQRIAALKNLDGEVK